MSNNTVACPTFDSARGGQISKQYSISDDLPSHKPLKYWEQSNGTIDELHDHKESEERERGDRKKVKAHRRLVIESSRQAAAPNVLKRPKVDRENDDDDIAALMDELLHIRKGNATEQTNKESEKRQEEEERIRAENVFSGDPFLDYSCQSGSVDMKDRRRWDDDVAFKNCARSEPNKNKNVFVNDSVRNESHRKFMEKYFK